MLKQTNAKNQQKMNSLNNKKKLIKNKFNHKFKTITLQNRHKKIGQNFFSIDIYKTYLVILISILQMDIKARH